MTPLQVWLAVKKVMDVTHGSYIGHNRQYIVDRVCRSRKEMDFGDKFRAVECLHNVMSDSDCPFLHYHASFPDKSNPKELMQLMVFANPTLIPLLKFKKLDLFVDATFDCCPAPFYQCLIVMVFDDQTCLYVPVVYILMTHKNDELYCEAIARIPVLVDFKLDCHPFTSNFERALIDDLKRHLDTSQHVGCYFYLKQAWWKYMRDVLKFDEVVMTLACSARGLDMLTLIPQDEVVQFGIPFLRKFYDFCVDNEKKKKWDAFWAYFETQ